MSSIRLDSLSSLSGCLTGEKELVSNTLFGQELPQHECSTAHVVVLNSGPWDPASATDVLTWAEIVTLELGEFGHTEQVMLHAFRWGRPISGWDPGKVNSYVITQRGNYPGTYDRLTCNNPMAAV